MIRAAVENISRICSSYLIVSRCVWGFKSVSIFISGLSLMACCLIFLFSGYDRREERTASSCSLNPRPEKNTRIA
jgi:hypothetical protein